MSDLALKQQLHERGLLEQFSEDAIKWAEQAGIRWIELGGEPWTLVSELERKKGVEPGDFTTNTKPAVLAEALLEKQGEPSTALQRLLQVPGVKRASVPTAFRVKGGYALACGGPSAKAGITAMVRQQIPEWALAGYTLVNLPLALAYLQHGRSEVAKATRDLTIGTTMNVAKAAAERENVPLAVHQLAGLRDAELLAQIQVLISLAKKTEEVELRANDAHSLASNAHCRIDCLEQKLLKPAPRTKSVSPSKATRALLMQVWADHYNGMCPRCKEQIRQADITVDHWFSRDQIDSRSLWVVCGRCNTEMGAPVGNGGKKRSSACEQAFRTFQEMLELAQKASDGIQLRLGL